MRLQLILNEAVSTDSAKNGLETNMKQMTAVINASTSQYKEKVNQKDDSFTPVMANRGISEWFTKNYKASKKGNGYGVQSAATQWKSTTDNPKLKSLLTQLSSIKRSALSGSSDKTTAGSNSDNFYSALDTMIEIGKENGGSLGQAANAAVQAKADFKKAFAAYQKAKADWDFKYEQKFKDSQKATKAKKDPSTGKQQDQVEQIVNQVLKDINSKDAARIRTTIARSDNKLKALQAELAKMETAS